MTAPAGGLRETGYAPPLVNRGERRHPGPRRAPPAAWICGPGTLLVSTRLHGRLDAPADERVDGNRRVAGLPTLNAVGPGRQPQGQTVDAATRAWMAGVRQRQVAGEVVTRAREPMTVQDGGRAAMNALVAVEDGGLEERGHLGDPPARDCRTKAQPGHHFPAVRQLVFTGRPVRRPVEDRRELGAGHRRTTFLPGVVHAVQHIDVTRPRDTNVDVAFRVWNEDLAHRAARHLRHHADADGGVGCAEVAHRRESCHADRYDRARFVDRPVRDE